MRQAAGRGPRSPSGRWLAVAILTLLLGAPSSAQQQPDASAIPLDGKTEASLREVARQVNNPIGPLWQVTFDNQVLGLGGGGLDGVEPGYTGSLEPRVPLELGRLGLGRFDWAADLQIVTRLTLPFVDTVPVPAAPGGDVRSSGFGDIQFGSVLAPTRMSGWIWGIGPTFIFPSASGAAFGQGKWQAGPAALAGYMGSRWTAYALAQQWWSFAGDGDRPETNQLCLNYVLLRNLPGSWQVGMQPTLEVDWTASGGSRVSFPVGLGVGRTVRIGKLPVQLWLEADYYPVRPDDLSGPRWGIDLQIVPVIPNLF